MLSFEPPDARAYGRIVRDGSGRLKAIVEDADADDAQRAIGEVNSSIYVFEADKLWPVLERIEPANAQGELYLTDAVRLLVEGGEEVVVFKAPDADEVEGVNTRAELADAAAFLRARVNREHMLAGVTIVDPADDLDRSRRRARARLDDSSVHGPARPHPRCGRRRGGPARRRR